MIISQVIWTTALGLYFGAIYKKTNETSISNDKKYRLKYTRKSNKMNLLDKKDTSLCDILIGEDLVIYLENNLTDYELFCHETYIKSLSDGETPNKDNLLAEIQWDALSKKSKAGLAKLIVYVEEVDLELFQLFACSSFLVYRRYMDAKTLGDNLVDAASIIL